MLFALVFVVRVDLLVGFLFCGWLVGWSLSWGRYRLQDRMLAAIGTSRASMAVLRSAALLVRQQRRPVTSIAAARRIVLPVPSRSLCPRRAPSPCHHTSINRRNWLVGFNSSTPLYTQAVSFPFSTSTNDDDDKSATSGSTSATPGTDDGMGGDMIDKESLLNQMASVRKIVVRGGILLASGFAAYMITSGAFSLSTKLLSISPLGFLNLGFASGVVFVAVGAAAFYRFKASTFVRPERLYYQAMHLIDADRDLRLKLGVETLHHADQLRVYSLRPSFLGNLFRPTTFELGFRVEGTNHDGVACVVGQQSAWTGTVDVKLLAVHVVKDAPETVLLEGSMEDAERLRFKFAQAKNDFRDVACLPVGHITGK